VHEPKFRIVGRSGSIASCSDVRLPSSVSALPSGAAPPTMIVLGLLFWYTSEAYVVGYLAIESCMRAAVAARFELDFWTTRVDERRFTQELLDMLRTTWRKRKRPLRVTRTGDSLDTEQVEVHLLDW